MGREDTGAGVLSPEVSAGLLGSLAARTHGAEAPRDAPYPGRETHTLPAVPPACPVRLDGFVLSYPAAVS